MIFDGCSFVELTVIQVRPAQPAGRYVPPRNVSKTMPGVSLAPEPKQWYLILRVRGNIPKSLGFDWVAFSSTHSSSGFELSDNIIRNHRARGEALNFEIFQIERPKTF